MLGRSNGGVRIVVGKFKNSLAGGNDVIDDALEYTLSMISGTSASVSDTMDDAKNRGRGRRSLSRATFSRTWRGPTLFLCSVEPLLEQCGECHSLAFRHGQGVAVHSVLEVQDDANWAWRRDVSPR